MHSSHSLPPLDGLLAVIAAHRTGSFSAAAEMLGITHGAVSRRVHAVEHWLSTPLFTRHGRGVQTTPAGQRFVATAEQALAALRDSADLWRPGREMQVVRLSAVPSVVRLWLMSKMHALQGTPADTRVELQLDHRIVDLNADDADADIALRYGNGRWKSCVSQWLFGERLCPVAAPAIAAKLGAHPKPERIAQLPLLHDSDTRQWRAWLGAHAIRHRPKSADRRFEDYDLVLAAAVAELGVALLRTPLADAYVRSGRLVRLSRSTVSDERGHYLVMRNDEHRPGVLRIGERLKSCAAELARGG
jgi:LysR family transcriptional regulator, glycine cleavage system transcriptional activator